MFLVTAVLSLMVSGCLPIPAGDLMPAFPGGLEPAALPTPPHPNEDQGLKFQG